MAKKETNEFEAARKKRRAKIATGRFKKFVGAALLFAIVCGAVYIFVTEDVIGIIGDRIASAGSGGTMPVEMAGNSVTDTFTCGDNIGILTDGAVYLYAKSGKLLLSQQHDMVNPVVEASGRRFLIYDQGGTKLMVRMRDKVLFEKEFDNTIISASLSDDGWLSVVTKAQRYASKLSVWDSTYETEVFSWSASNEYIVCGAADAGSKTVAAAALSANDYGEIVTTVNVFTTEAAVELSKREFKGAAVISLAYDGNGDVKLVCDSLAALIDRNGKLLGNCYFDREPIRVINQSGSAGAAVIFDRYTESRATEIIFLGEKFENKKTVSVSGKFVCASAAGSKTAVYCSGTVNVFDRNGERTATLVSEPDALLIQLTKESVFAVNRTELREVKS